MSKIALTILVNVIATYSAGTSSCESNLASENCYDFRIFSCGIFGGAFQGQLTSFLLADVENPNNFLSMDVGTSMDCLQNGYTNGQLDIILDTDGYAAPGNEWDKVGYFRNKQLNGFLVSHVHLDHIGGMIISSADDESGPKHIISRPIVINQLYDKVWTDLLWPSPYIFKYYNVSVNENNTMFTDLSAYTDYNYKLRTFPLVHTVNSTAFFICNADETSCILFLGDTGPDPVEKSDDLRNLWMAVAPYVANGKLTTIFMESSYTSSRADNLLFGHLSTKWMLYELYVLAKYVAQEPGAKSIPLEGLSVVVIHIKPTFKADQDTAATRDIIYEELTNPTNESYALLGVNFIVPEETAMIYAKSGKLTKIYFADNNPAKAGNTLRCIHVFAFVSFILAVY